MTFCKKMIWKRRERERRSSHLLRGLICQLLAFEVKLARLDRQTVVFAESLHSDVRRDSGMVLSDQETPWGSPAFRERMKLLRYSRE